MLKFPNDTLISVLYVPLLLPNESAHAWNRNRRLTPRSLWSWWRWGENVKHLRIAGPYGVSLHSNVGSFLQVWGVEGIEYSCTSALFQNEPVRVNECFSLDSIRSTKNWAPSFMAYQQGKTVDLGPWGEGIFTWLWDFSNFWRIT